MTDYLIPSLYVMYTRIITNCVRRKRPIRGLFVKVLVLSNGTIMQELLMECNFVLPVNGFVVK